MCEICERHMCIAPKYKDSAAQTSPAFVKAANEAAKAKKARLAGAAKSREARMAEERGRAAIMTSDDDSPPRTAKRKTPTSKKKRSTSSGTPKQSASKKVRDRIAFYLRRSTQVNGS